MTDRSFHAAVADLMIKYGPDHDLQDIDWHYGNWRSWFSDTGVWSGVLDDLRGGGPDDRCLISRADLAAFGRMTIKHLFLAAMVWGFGTTGYGAWRTRQMVDTEGFPAILEDIVGEVRSSGAGRGYGKLFVKGQPRVRRLGPAYGTKLLYAASLGCPISPPPLVFDSMVEKALRQLAPDLTWLPKRNAWITASQYEKYCTWAKERADECGVAPDVVEFSLFRHGFTLPTGS